MSTYLLTWNPRKSQEPQLETWAKEFADDHRHSVVGRWSCGRRRDIEVGDRVFLLRQGTEQPGLVGSGWVERASFQAPSWRLAGGRRDGMANYVQVAWDSMLVSSEGIARERLLRGLLPPTLVNSQAGGVKVATDAAFKLEREWARHLKREPGVAALVLACEERMEGEPVEHRVLRRKRDRKLRRDALDKSEGVCAACRVDFSRILEGRGLRVLQVHHRQQLSMLTAPKLNSVQDLAVVCANCHALIHDDPRKAMAVEELRRQWSRVVVPIGV
jgi:5-methylcytosine-specific restriction enzyme A